MTTAWQRITGLRRKPVVVDAGLGLGLLALSVLFLTDWSSYVWWSATLVALATVFVRHRWPAVTVVVGVLAALLHMVMGFGVTAVDVVGLIGLFTATAVRGRRFSLALLAFGLVAVGAIQLRTMVWGGFPVLAMSLVLAWSAGLSAHIHKAYLTGLEQRAEVLERERDAKAELAVAEERARISRELHDDVAHGLAVMVLQAQGAAAELDHQPERTREALTAIADTGRRALADTRRLLGAIGQDDTGVHWSPPPGVRRLPRLVDQVRTAGRSVDLRIEGEPCTLPSTVDLAGYRIVQEALTNVIKHAGAEATATVVLCYQPGVLEVAVTDDGTETSVGEGGNGLRGMRERVAVLGGTFQAGPTPGGGFLVRASLPL